jgi:hypothetical protein
MMNWKRCERRQSLPNLKVIFRHLPGATEESHKQLSQDRRISGTEYEAGVLTT